MVPLAHGQAVAIGVTSYDGGLYYGVNADRDGMPDVDVIAQCLVDALAELAEAPVRGPDDGGRAVGGVSGRRHERGAPDAPRLRDPWRWRLELAH